MKVIREILGLLWKLVRQVLWARIKGVLGKLILVGLFLTAVVSFVVYVVVR